MCVDERQPVAVRIGDIRAPVAGGAGPRHPDQHPDDRRRHRVALTPAGRALLNRLRPVAKQSQKGFLEALTAAEQRTLISLLRRVLSANDAVRQAPESRQ
ncbi:MAG: MarR family winged helix-turn-helix transcriptional regulator [Nitrososphaeraceae archaeon]